MYSFGQAFADGVMLFQRRYGGVLGAICLLLALGLACSVVHYILTYAFGLSTNPDDLTLIDLLVTVFLIWPLNPGIWVLMSFWIRDEPGGVDMLFLGFKRYWRIIGTSCLVILAIYIIPVLAVFFPAFLGGLLMPAGEPGIAIGFIVLCSLLSLPVLLFMIARMWWAIPMCVDPRLDLGVIESIGRSWDMTRGHSLSLMALEFVMFAILIVSAALFVLPMIFLGLPIVLGVGGAAYTQLAFSEPVTTESDTGLNLGPA